LNSFGGQVNLVLHITAPVDYLIDRLAGRWICKAQGHAFHEHFNQPREKGICDIDGSDLYQREDDKAETVLKRIEVYENQTAPLIQYYQERGLLIEINGIAAIEEVSMQVMSVLQKEKSSDYAK